METVYRFADIPVRAVFTHSYLLEQCRGYETDEAPLLTVEVTERDIEEEQKRSDGARYPLGYLESLTFYRKFTTAAAAMDVLLFHGSAVAFDGRCYIFTARSGTGKSTHTGLCAKRYGERFYYVNDDKPLLRLRDGVWYVYGTPWDGKHRLSTNTCVPLGGICFLHRGQTNTIARAEKSAVFSRLLGQTFRPDEPTALARVLTLAVSLSDVPLWTLYCTISEEAAALSLPTMAALQ